MLSPIGALISLPPFPSLKDISENVRTGKRNFLTPISPADCIPISDGGPRKEKSFRYSTVKKAGKRRDLRCGRRGFFGKVQENIKTIETKRRGRSVKTVEGGAEKAIKKDKRRIKK